MDLTVDFPKDLVRGMVPHRRFDASVANRLDDAPGVSRSASTSVTARPASMG